MMDGVRIMKGKGRGVVKRKKRNEKSDEA